MAASRFLSDYALARALNRFLEDGHPEQIRAIAVYLHDKNETRQVYLPARLIEHSYPMHGEENEQFKEKS